MNQEISNITLALAAGAAANFRPNSVAIPITEQPLYDTYSALRNNLEQHYPSVQVDLLDIAPASVERQRELDGQLKKSGALDDETLQAEAAALLVEISAHAPEAFAAISLDHGTPPSVS